MKARLYQKYVNEVVPALKAKHQYANVHQIPRLEKIVVNMGVSASLEKGAIDDAAALAFVRARQHHDLVVFLDVKTLHILKPLPAPAR